MICGIVAGGAMIAESGGGAPVSAKHWRLYVTANNGATSYRLSFGYMTLMDALGGSSIATGGTATSSDDYYPESAFDNNMYNFYTSSDSVDLPLWVAYELTAAAEVVQYAIRAGASSRLSRMPKDWELQNSTDGVVWHTIHSVAGEAAWAEYEVRTFTL